jgi:hypothetical protein
MGSFDQTLMRSSAFSRIWAGVVTLSQIERNLRENHACLGMGLQGLSLLLDRPNLAEFA